MPRPTNAQLVYGSLTVVLSTFVMLLLSDAQSGAAVAAVGAGGLILGLLVAVTLATPAGARGRSAVPAPSSAEPPASPPAASVSASAAQRPLPRAAGGRGVRESRVSEASLRR